VIQDLSETKLDGRLKAAHGEKIYPDPGIEKHTLK
jgi:hypothetical protein